MRSITPPPVTWTGGGVETSSRSPSRSTGGGGGRAVLVGGVARVPARADARDAARGRGRRLAFLCPGPVRGHLLAERRRLELRCGGAAGQQLPEAAATAPILLGQHRAAPCAPPERQGPQLQPAARPRPEPDLPRRADALAVGRSAGGAAQALGRGAGAAGDLRGGAGQSMADRDDLEFTYSLTE